MTAAHTIDTRHVYKRSLHKPDGRALYLYSRAPIADTIAPAPDDGGDLARNPHMRWHPLRGEWIAYAPYRQHRTFLPPAEYDPLAPTRDAAHPTELPGGEYDIAVFENRFPTFYEGAHDPPREIIETAPGRGACEVVVYTKESQGSLGALPLWNVEMIVDVWADRTLELGARDDVEYVFPFENRGVEIGVTLHHPHGQIYAYPFVPPVAERMLGEMRAHYERTGKGLLATYVEAELADARRIVHAGSRCVAFVPACARWAYETWVVPFRPVARLPELSPNERADFARTLKTALMKLDGLFARPMPYVMVIHQAPTDGGAHLEAHVHVEIFPALRMPNRLKYLAGSEIGAGVFTADTFPEDKADELRRIEVNVE